MNEEISASKQSHTEQALVIPKQQVMLLLGLLILASILFVIGVFQPMITLSKFIIIKSSFSVISGVTELWFNGQYILFIMIATFSIVLPLFKIAVLFKLLFSINSTSQKIKQYLHLMHEYGRWAMLDVMVVAVLIVTVKLGAIASIQVHYGLYVFGAAVMLIMLITHRVVKLTDNN